MRLVVTGGAGDLGSRVVRGLADRGVEVVSASRRSGVDLTTGLGLESVLADPPPSCARPSSTLSQHTSRAR